MALPVTRARSITSPSAGTSCSTRRSPRTSPSGCAARVEHEAKRPAAVDLYLGHDASDPVVLVRVAYIGPEFRTHRRPSHLGQLAAAHRTPDRIADQRSRQPSPIAPLEGYGMPLRPFCCDPSTSTIVAGRMGATRRRSDRRSMRVHRSKAKLASSAHSEMQI